jgi:hypothetical protein
MFRSVLYSWRIEFLHVGFVEIGRAIFDEGFRLLSRNRFQAPVADEHQPYTSCSQPLAQIRDDIVAVKDFEQDELILDPTFSSNGQTDEGFLGDMEEILRMV